MISFTKYEFNDTIPLYKIKFRGDSVPEIYYDSSDPEDIELYAKKLIGKTFKDVLELSTSATRETTQGYSKNVTYYEDFKSKGGLGHLLEEHYFHYAINSDSSADFLEAGVELKVTPYKINKNKTISAKERLVITMIDYMAVINEQFESSHLLEKSRLMLLIYYLYQIKMNRLDYRIDYVSLFSFPKEDLKIIHDDWDKIINIIKIGKAHELSEGDTLYLGACTKGATSANVRQQPYSNIPAKQRAFCLKTSYMTFVLNTYIITSKRTYEPIIKNNTELLNTTFEDYITNKINKYVGLSVKELCINFNINYEKRAKNLESRLAFKILGINSNNAEEFVKANIVVKSIRLNHNSTIKESMSFSAFKFKELVEEEWENSTLYNYLSETRFFFVIYKFDQNDILRLKGCQFWNIPYNDLENEVYKVWSLTRKIILEGIKITIRNGKHYNNLPSASENPVCHVRPHAQNRLDTYELPDGSQFTKQSFWLNNTYIASQLKEQFKN